jgi:hypothetical protein
MAGTDGAAGMAGTDGAAGMAGSGGGAGEMDGGSAGMAGTSGGTAGMAGTSGGSAGMAGTTGGSAGMAGTTGGTAGMAGTTGAMPDGGASDADASDGATDGSTADAPANDAPTGCTANAECNDLNPCTDDTCDVGTGVCQHSSNTNGCDDGNPCTAVDQCSAGQCVGSGAPDCDDHSACTTDSCDQGTGCVHAAVVCNDSSSCTDDSCDPSSGCKFEDNGSCVVTPPDAGSDAGQGGAGAGGAGGGGTGGTGSTPGCTSNAECDDNNQCTNDVCNGGTCSHADITSTCNDGNGCTVDSCNPQTGCAHTAADDGTSCDDPFSCTMLDSCVAGVCVGGIPTQFTALTATGSAGGDASLAVDGNASTTFSPTAANPRWIYVDLGGSKQISRVQLDWGTTTYDGYYTLQVASEAGNDATTLATDAVWTSIYTQSLWDNATGHSDDITGLNAVGRYVRVYYWLPKTGFAVSTTAFNLAELKVFGGTDPACTAPPGSCAESTVPAGPITYENDAAGNTCAVVNGGAACGTKTAADVSGTATIISARGVLSFANVDGGVSGGAATVTFKAAGASGSRTAAAVYVKYDDGTEQGYGPITTTSAAVAATQSVQVWLKSGAHNTIEVRDSAGAADVNGLPIVDSVTVAKLAGPNKTCAGAPFVIDSFEGAPTNDWNLSVAAGVTSGDRRGITKSGTVNTAFQGNATTVANPPTGDICLRMDVTNFTWVTKLSNMSGLDNGYVQLILGANTGTPSLTLALTSNGVAVNTPVVLGASNNTNTNNGYGVIRNNMTGADTATSKVLVPISAFGVSSDTLKQVDGLKATLSGNIWRIKDIQIVR